MNNAELQELTTAAIDMARRACTTASGCVAQSEITGPVAAVLLQKSLDGTADYYQIRKALLNK